MMAARFFLGVFEAGLFPGVSYLLRSVISLLITFLGPETFSAL